MHIEKKTLRNIFIGTIVCILLYWILHDTERARSIFRTLTAVFSPFLIGGAIAFILNVPMRGFEKLFQGIKKQFLRRVVAVVLTFICFLLILSLVFWMLIPQLIEAVGSLIPSVTSFFINMEGTMEALVNDSSIFGWLGVESFDWVSFVEGAMSVVGTNIESIIYNVFDAIKGLMSGVFNAFIAIVFSVYCLFQKETLARQARKLLYAFLPENAADKTVEVARLSNETFSNFLSGQCIEVCILGSLFAITMSIFGMPYAALISVLIAVTAFIPIVGAWIGCVFGAFFIFVDSYVNGGSGMQAIWFVVMFIALQLIENNLIYPRVVGSSIGLPGMWVLLAVGVGGELFGVGGMFIMIPVASVVYTVIRRATNKRLDGKEIDENKLKSQPPELHSKIIKKVKKMTKKDEK